MTIYCGVDFHGMRCKDFFRAREFFKYVSLSSDSEQGLDELRLPLRITSC